MQHFLNARVCSSISMILKRVTKKYEKHFLRTYILVTLNNDVATAITTKGWIYLIALISNTAATLQSAYQTIGDVMIQ